MNINNFEQTVENKILNRGLEYYEDGHIDFVEQIDQGEFNAIISGSDEYQVYIRLDNEYGIIEKDCSCPYDWGSTCKHEVAVLYHIREKGIHKKTASSNELATILEEVDEEELRKFVFTYLKRNREFREDFTQEFG